MAELAQSQEFSEAAVYSAVRDLLVVADLPPRPGVHPVDFVIDHPQFGVTAIEVKLGRVRAQALFRLESRLNESALEFKTFLLVAPEEQDFLQSARFNDFLKTKQSQKYWIPLQRLPAFLGVEAVDLRDPEERKKLQDRAFAVSFASPLKSAILRSPSITNRDTENKNTVRGGFADDLEKIGPYRLVERIASGGRGAAFGGIDERNARKVFLLVSFRAAHLPDSLIERFLTESRAVAKLQHPNIATLLDFGVDDGRVYQVFERVHGDPMSRLLPQQADIPVATKIRYVLELLEALQFAHDYGVRYGVLDPANILISNGRVKLLDFGAAWHRIEATSGLTRTGVLVGRVQYLSPEQILGKPPADGRSDIFNVGLLMFELLTGKFPWQTDSEFDLITNILHTPIPPLSSFLPDCSPEWDTVMQKALNKNPDDRYQTASEMIREIQRVFIVGEANVLPPKSFPPGSRSDLHVEIPSERRVPPPPPPSPQSSGSWGFTRMLSPPFARRQEYTKTIDAPAVAKALTPIGKPDAIPFEYRTLSRQFSASTVRQLYDSGPPLQSHLKIGNPIPDAVVILSDIKNFSTLVRLANSAALRDAVGKYYRGVRDLVWSYGGVLDKFIGDAVFAVFNYPEPITASQSSAVRFSRELIQLGRLIFEDLASDLNEIVETGTRIGMAQGDLWVLDIGEHSVEVSFIGNTINLAARLEKACEVNGILLDHRSYTAFCRTEPDQGTSLAAELRTLDPGEAKGQLTQIRCWQVKPQTVLGCN